MDQKTKLRCKKCKGEIKLFIRCRSVDLYCLSCGKRYLVSEYTDEISDEMWEMISTRPSDRG